MAQVTLDREQRAFLLCSTCLTSMPFFFSFFFLFISNLFSHLNAVKSLSSCSPFFSFLLFSRSTFYFNAPHFFAFCFFTNERFLFFFLLLIFLGIRFEIWFLLSASTLFFSPFSVCFQCMRDSHEGRSVSNSSKNHKKREKKKKRERKNSKVAWVSKCAVWICACICKKVVLADFSFFFFLKLLLSFFFFNCTRRCGKGRLQRFSGRVCVLVFAWSGGEFLVPFPSVI